MGSISKSYGYDVGKFGDPSKPYRTKYKGTERGGKSPRGVTDRFVDLQGNVVTAQLISKGVPKTAEAEAKARAVLHNHKSANGKVHGFVEHDLCPVRHGIRFRNDALRDEFAAMPEALQKPCEHDPAKPTRGADGVVEFGDGCPHIEWLIASRRQRERERLVGRLAIHESAVEIERQKLEAMKAQADEQRRTNEELLKVISAQRRRGGE